MENASKALIIAGAILISILLIAVAMIVMNSINNPIQQATDQATSQAIEMFNAKFTGYAGQQSSASVKSLMTSIASNNGVNPDHQITVGGSLGTTPGAVQAAVSSQKTYTVTFTYGSSGADNGYITGVDVK